GLAGLLLLFGGEVAKDLARPEMLWGLGLALAGTYCFSLGNLLSGAMQRQGQTPLQTNAWAMAIGATAIALYALASGQARRLDALADHLGGARAEDRRADAHDRRAFGHGRFEVGRHAHRQRVDRQPRLLQAAQQRAQGRMGTPLCVEIARGLGYRHQPAQ